jgi:hypothetical protein
MEHVLKSSLDAHKIITIMYQKNKENILAAQYTH